jgi:diguanylate cyclase (GGDEF)-like protein
MAHRIAVYSGRADLAPRLRESSEVVDGGDEREACRIAVIDVDSHGRLEDLPVKSFVRLILCDGSVPLTRRNGELRVDRDAFLRDPAEHLSFANDLVDAVVHATHLEQEVGYLTQIHELMTMVEAEAVSERITETILGILGLTRGTLYLHDPRLERYVVSFTNDPEHHDSTDFLPGIPPDVLQQALASPRLFAVSRGANGSGMAVMPLQVQEDLLGVIKVPLGPSDDIDTDVAVNVTKYLSAVAQVLSNIYQLTRSRDLAMRDDLTKAYNRRFFETYLDEEIERSRRFGAQFSIIFLDLDDLKQVNAMYGHLAGSRTLQEVAKRILNAVRGIDKVVRFGGDEFCIILPQTDPEQAMLVANRVRRSLGAAPLQIDADVEVTITASFGIATFPFHGLTKETLIREADAAMYRVKSTTKNAVGVAGHAGARV